VVEMSKSILGVYMGRGKTVIKKKKKLYEAYRHSEIFNEDRIIFAPVRASSMESARNYFKEQLKKQFGDERHFFVREKK
jgi:hypothetical protein